MDTIVYKIDNNLYVNMTNKCSNNCDFCVRNHMDKYENYSLWLDREPTVEEIVSAIKLKFNGEKEIVFCGFGEPTYRIYDLLEVCAQVKDMKVKTRINTNGQVKLIMPGFNVESMLGLVDKVNISLNATDSAKYQEVCHSEFGDIAFSTLLDLGRELKEIGIAANFSIVDVVGKEELKIAQKLADRIGIPLKIREYIS